MPGHRGDVTGLLQAWGEGDEQALHQLMPLVERELNRIARACLAGEAGNRSVPATALVEQTYTLFRPLGSDARFVRALDRMRRDVEAQRERARTRGLLELKSLIGPEPQS